MRMAKKNKIKVNTGTDYLNLGLHGLGYAALLGGATMVAASPVITGIAVATTLAIKFGAVKYIKDRYRDALPDEEKGLTAEFNQQSGRSEDVQTKLHSAFERMKEFSHKMGLTEAPSFHFLDDESYSRSKEKPASTGRYGEIKDMIREGLQLAFREVFNKHANAFAFSHRKGRVALSQPLVETLDENEINAVTAHEVGHIAAGHTTKRELFSMMSMPAQITANIFSLAVTFSSLKNVGLVVLGNLIGGIMTGIYSVARRLDTENNVKDKAEQMRVRGIFNRVSKIGVGIAFAAPDLVVAQSFALATKEGSLLLGKSFSRANEYQADRLAAEATRDPMALISGLDKAVAHNIEFERGMGASNDTERKGGLSTVFNRAKELYRTHPTNDNRRAQMEKMALAM